MHDPWWTHAFLAVHIATGGGAFVLAPLALIRAKGGKAHRMWGRIYFWCMAIVAFTALVMATYRPVVFLALMAIFQLLCVLLGLPRARSEGRLEGRSRRPWTGLGRRRLLLRSQPNACCAGSSPARARAEPAHPSDCLRSCWDAHFG